MLKVLHFDYDPDCGQSFKARAKFSLDGKIQYELMTFEKRTVEWDTNQLEERIPDYDVLLIHPGVKRQARVIDNYPRMFPKQKIAVIINTPNDYERSPAEMTELSYLSSDKILDYLLALAQIKDQ